MNSTLLLATLVGVFFPAYILLTYKKINTRIKKQSRYRLLDYKQTILIFWVLTITILINYFVHQQPKMNFYPKISWINVGIMIVALVLSAWQYKTIKHSDFNHLSVKEKIKHIYHYLPRNTNELNWFILLSVSAGICEEIMFRLFLFEFVKNNIGVISAFAISNLIFALTHIGSGKLNMINSFILGLLFSSIYYYTENIWIAVVLHVLIDINIGILGYRVSKHEKYRQS